MNDMLFFPLQVVCDSQLIFQDIDARWPGSSHDAFVLNMSRVPDVLGGGDMGPNWILGDSGYPCKEWLMTPLLEPGTEAESRYNRTFKPARASVERALGVLKSRFR